MGGLMEPAVEIAAEKLAKAKVEKAILEAVEEAKIKATVVATAKTKKNILIESVRKMMKKLNLTAQQAMDILDVPADKQKEYLALI